MAIIYMSVDGNRKELDKRAYSVGEIHEMLHGGYMEFVTISSFPYTVVVCDDEGQIKRLKPNTALQKYMSEKDIYYPKKIVGDVIVLESFEELQIFDGQIDPVTKNPIMEGL